MKKINDKALKGLIALLFIIVITAALARSLKGSQTLSDYAAEHPDEQVKVEIFTIEEDDSEAELFSRDDLEAESADAGAADVVTKDSAISGAAATETDTIGDAIVGAGDTASDESVIDKRLSFVDEYEDTESRVNYADGFYYEPIPEAVKARMQGTSYPEDIDETKVNYDSLRYLVVKYVDFDGNTEVGELVCNKMIVKDLADIFYELYQADYRIESIRLIDDFEADDTASMAANNTSCFCYRVVDGSTSLSRHAYGMAVDLNPFYNPYVVFKSGEDDYISPPGSEIYADRSQSFSYKIDESDLAYKLFKEHGFRWGGDWNSCKDYQHFDKK